MAYTQADLERVNRAIASSELEVQYDGKRVRYRSQGELLQARATILKDLEQQAPRKQSRVSRLRHGGKGV
ncbi:MULTISPECIES: phage head-tail joining protein [Cupriavidus]|uniref:Uncharacterized protein n=1 Tax=Cupriavidus nantongensis TaxID=1796606 RepID=A0A142JMH1_9BURK|nr:MULTISPECIES: hypothetical protein [Cupriavidus]AMR79283.1 hypothetical protein A2G96_16915 [Cupriavidus nantongensis]MEC3765002.1 hypothetical protein [Cupriavidus sp. SS-3]